MVGENIEFLLERAAGGLKLLSTALSTLHASTQAGVYPVGSKKNGAGLAGDGGGFRRFRLTSVPTHNTTLLFSNTLTD